MGAETASDHPVIAAFIAAQRLPASFADLAQRLHIPLARRIAEAAEQHEGLLVVGLCGPQGAGKSTLVELVSLLLRGWGLASASLSLDDLYLTQAERMALGQRVHPLLRTRGVPGTHDIALGLRLLDDLARTGPALIPRFDKAADDRLPMSAWSRFEGPAKVVLLEGWCLGARPQPPSMLVESVNALERDEDPAAIWRTFCNTALAGAYAELFARVDLLTVMTAPDFATVRAWRGEQEHRLRDRLIAKERDPGLAMTDPALDRFLDHYQRLTEWIAQDLPDRADIAIALDADRRPIDVRGL